MATDTKDPAAELERMIGGAPQEVAETLRIFEENIRIVDQRRPRYLKRYNNEWIAFFAGRVQAHSPSIESVLNSLDRKGLTGLDRRKVVIQFITDEPRVAIF